MGGSGELWSLGPVDLCRSVKDEKRGAAEIEPWPGAACIRHHQRHVSKGQQPYHNIRHSASSAESWVTFIWLL